MDQKAQDNAKPLVVAAGGVIGAAIGFAGGGLGGAILGALAGAFFSFLAVDAILTRTKFAGEKAVAVSALVAIIALGLAIVLLWGVGR